MKEIEIELEVENFDELRQKVDYTGIDPTYTTVYYYDQERLKAGEIIRVRRRVSKEREVWDLSYKGKIKDAGGVQVREENTVKIQNPKEFLTLMENLFGKPVYVQKLKTIKTYIGNVKVRITDTNIQYIEFEGPKEEVQKVFNELNLKGRVLKQSAAFEILKRAGVI